MRRYYYSVALLEHSDTVRKTYLDSSTPFNKLFVYASWGGVKKLMTNAMDLGKEQGGQSKEIIEGELDWLDGFCPTAGNILWGTDFHEPTLPRQACLPQ